MTKSDTHHPRVLLVNRMLSMVRGGGETFDLEIARHMDELGCDIQFLSGIPLFTKARLGPPEWVNNLQSSDQRHGVSRWHVIRTPYAGWFPWESFRGAWRVRWADFVLFEKAAARWAWRHREAFDIIQVCELPTFVSEWKERGAETPVVMRLTAGDFYDPCHGVRKADAVIASGATMEACRQGARKDCVNIPNGVDTEMFKPQPSPLRQKLGIDDEICVLLSVARFQAVKNHRLLIRSFAEVQKTLPDSILVLAGSGPLEREMKLLCRELRLGEKVRFLGEVPFDETPSLYAGADIAVVSSDYESFCFAALEAMATELPLVVTDTDWVPGLISEKFRRHVRKEPAEVEIVEGGVVVPVGDKRALAEGLRMIGGNPELRQQMGRYNRQRVLQQFTWGKSAEALVRIYQSLLSI